jgi:hypothetical protein
MMQTKLPEPPRWSGLPETPDAADWAPALAQAFAGLACDLALVLDAGGVVIWAAEGGRAPLPELAMSWVGHAWADTVAPACQGKAQSLLADLATKGVASRREMDLATDPPLPMAFAALRLGVVGPSVLLGHDLRPEAALQQRFLRAQRDLEQGYQEALDQLALKAADARQAAAAIASLLPAARDLLAPAPRRRVSVRRHPQRSRRRKLSQR